MEELQNVESKIPTIRGLTVMQDSDFAELYGVKTKKIPSPLAYVKKNVLLCSAKHF